MVTGVLSTLFTASALAMDAFSVSIAVSACQVDMRIAHAMRIVIFFGFFQFFMPIVGGLLGNSLSGFFAAWDHWIAFTVLAFVGLNMIIEAKQETEDCKKFDVSRLGVVVFLAVATSLDAMAVGFSFATLHRPIIYVAVSTGVITGFLSLIGIKAGSRLGIIIGQKAQIVGGTLLCLIGINILAVHLNLY